MLAATGKWDEVYYIPADCLDGVSYSEAAN